MAFLGTLKLKWKQYLFQPLGGFWSDPSLWGCIKIFFKNCGKYLMWYPNVHVIKIQYFPIFNNDLLNILSGRIELHIRDSVWQGGFLKGTTISVFGSGRTGSDGIAVCPQASSGVWRLRTVWSLLSWLFDYIGARRRVTVTSRGNAGPAPTHAPEACVLSYRSGRAALVRTVEYLIKLPFCGVGRGRFYVMTTVIT